MELSVGFLSILSKYFSSIIERTGQPNIGGWFLYHLVTLTWKWGYASNFSRVLEILLHPEFRWQYLWALDLCMEVCCSQFDLISGQDQCFCQKVLIFIAYVICQIWKLFETFVVRIWNSVWKINNQRKEFCSLFFDCLNYYEKY